MVVPLLLIATLPTLLLSLASGIVLYRILGLIRMVVEITDTANGITNRQDTTVKLLNYWSFDEV